MNNEYIKTKSIRKPGEPGTKKLTQIYGNDLICVRYKYDYKLKKRYKTIELQIEETPWIPNNNDRFYKKPVYILVHYH